MNTRDPSQRTLDLGLHKRARPNSLTSLPPLTTSATTASFSLSHPPLKQALHPSFSLFLNRPLSPCPTAAPASVPRKDSRGGVVSATNWFLVGVGQVLAARGWHRRSRILCMVRLSHPLIHLGLRRHSLPPLNLALTLSCWRGGGMAKEVAWR
jgi:hypothetical protein